jgi:hypothetical protein
MMIAVAVRVAVTIMAGVCGGDDMVLAVVVAIAIVVEAVVGVGVTNCCLIDTVAVVAAVTVGGVNVAVMGGLNRPETEPFGGIVRILVAPVALESLHSHVTIESDQITSHQIDTKQSSSSFSYNIQDSQECMYMYIRPKNKNKKLNQQHIGL